MATPLLVSFITNLATARIVIAALRKKDPRLDSITLPAQIYYKIVNEIHDERSEDYNLWRLTTIYGVWIKPEGPFHALY